MIDTIQTLAKGALTHFKSKVQRDRHLLWSLKVKRPGWVYEMVFFAHNSMPPEDYKYQFIVDALFDFGSCDDPKAAISKIKVSPYYKDLYSWLASNSERPNYCDKYAQNTASHGNIIELIRGGQLTEKREVYSLVLASLQKQLKETDTA